MFSRMERPGKEHQVFKVIKPLRVQGYIEVRTGSGEWLIREKFSREKDHPMFGTRRANGLANLRSAWSEGIFVY